MEHLQDYADDRLINGCIYCGGRVETREHVPSRCFLEPPYPANLPVVGACHKCNRSFSKDEQYVVCFLECAIVGSVEPDDIKRPSIARTLKRSPSLRLKIESEKNLTNNHIAFNVHQERIKNVMLKLAQGHAAYELSRLCRRHPDYFWCGPLESLTQDERECFLAAHIQQLYGEIGSRNFQRTHVAEVRFRSGSGKETFLHVLVNDWVEIQEGYYRYLAIDDYDGIIVKMVISEYVACEVRWAMSA